MAGFKNNGYLFTPSHTSTGGAFHRPVFPCFGRVMVRLAINPSTLYVSWLADLASKGYTPPTRHDGSGIDRSLQDIHVLRSMADAGVPRDTATEALHHGSEKAQERGESYVEHIVSAIWERPL